MTNAAAGRPGPAVWVDPGPVDGSWPTPVPTVDPGQISEPPAPSRWRTPVVWGSVLVGLVLVVVTVGALGGFRDRQDRFTPTEPGTTFTSGPFVLTFTEATAQYSLDDKTYEVVAIGTGRTTATTTMAPSSVNPVTFAQDPASREVQEVDAYTYGLSADILLRARAFTPGLPPIRFSAKFEFTAEPGDTVRVVVFDQEFRDASIFGDQDPTWVPTRTGHDLQLPVTRLPDREY